MEIQHEILSDYLVQNFIIAFFIIVFVLVTIFFLFGISRYRYWNVTKLFFFDPAYYVFLYLYLLVYEVLYVELLVRSLAPYIHSMVQ